MTFLNRLKWVTASLVVVGAITSAAVWGDATRGRATLPALPANKLFSDDVVGKFTNKPAVTYQGANGDVFFAFQVKPDLAAAPARPRDIAILVDASASQAGTPFEAARKIAKSVLAGAGESDRLSIWTVSTPKATKNLVRGGGIQSVATARSATTALDNEYASGAIDLKDTIERVSREFDGKATRQQVILYLGDGESALAPLDEASRYKLAESLRSQKIAFYAVPLGTPMNAHNIHTLVSGTGGAVIRPSDQKTDDAAEALKTLTTQFYKSLSVPVLNPTAMSFSTAAAEVYPSKLPPLRSDMPTLVVGRFEKGQVPASLELSIDGHVVSTATNIKVAHPLPTPSADNFFLGSMVTQWRTSGRVDSPAMLRADRTLALAFESTRLAREEFIEQADWALGAKKFDAAKTLFDAAMKLDPADPRVQAGAKLAKKLDLGEISLEALRKASVSTPNGPRVNVDALVQDTKTGPAPAGGAPADPKATDPTLLLKQEEAKQKIREQQTTVAVEETLARARDLLQNGDPKSAKDLLVGQRDTVRVVGDIGDKTRQQLLNRLDILLSDVGAKGDALVRQKAEENERINQARRRAAAQDQAVAREEKIRERIRNFTTLMNQARYEDAYREALVMENEHVNEGRPIPLETQAVARIGQAAVNYRDFRELVRLREDRYLLSMMEVEKAHMPYPDEPAVHFPPAKVWRELTARRREYSGTDFDRDLSPRQKDRYRMLQNSLLQVLDLRELKGAENEFFQQLGYLQELMSKKMKQDVTIYLNPANFKDFAATKKTQVNLETLKDSTENVLKEITFKSLLDTICRQANASFWVTPDYIEIVDIDRAATTKVFKVLPVEDLIVPIPNAVNQLALRQQLQVLGQQFSLAGGNAFGALGAFGGQVGGGIGGFGGGQGGQQGGFGGQLGGQLFRGGGQGGQGGALGFGGGNVGQLGNLGGQFGFQGGQQSNNPVTELVVLIQSVVDPGFWDPDVSFLGKKILQGKATDEEEGPGDTQIEGALRNKMMINLTTRSLVVYGRTRQHRSVGGTPLKAKDNMVAGPRANPDGREVANAKPPVDNNKPAVVKGPVPTTVKPKPGIARAPKNPADAELMWRTAIDKGVNEPGVIIACAEFLAETGEFKHASELIKASLRRGLTPERWYQEALAIALEESQGTAEEIERAYTSAIDLEPKNAQVYLNVARDLNARGESDSALRLCKVAAKLEPNVPDAYTSALAFAENPKATASYDMSAFAAGGLLGRDWPSDRGEYHAQARAHLLAAVKKLDAANKQAESDKVKALLDQDKNRDLVIELMWSGKSDLDLRVTEPIGTICSSINTVTTGGGSLREDMYDAKEDSQSETYAAAQAFSGTYKLKVEKIWGMSQGDKATIKVTRHQGSPEERVEFFTLNLKEQTELTLNFEGGRRTDLAVLPSPVDMAKYRSKTPSSVTITNKIRALVNGTGNVGLSGSVGAGSQSSMLASGTPEKRSGDLSWSTRLGSERSVGMDIRSETTILADGRASVRAVPVFDGKIKDASVKVDLIPGGNGD